MENCFVTMYKGVVNDDSLDVLGFSKFGFEILQDKTNANSKWTSVTFDGTGTVRIKGSQFVDGTTEKTATGTVSGSIEKAGKGHVYVSKYNVKQIQFGDAKINLADFSSWNTLTALKLVAYEAAAGKAYGNLSDVSGLTNLTNLALFSSDIVGDIRSLGALINLEDLDLRDHYTGLTGSVEEFVSTQRTNGRTTCEGITLHYPRSMGYVTFNGEIFYNIFTNSPATVTLSWTASTITLGDTTINA